MRRSVVSAHRTPDWLFKYAETARERGLRVIIAGAGGAAHLPGMLAAKTSSSGAWCSRFRDLSSTAWTHCSLSCKCPKAFR